MNDDWVDVKLTAFGEQYVKDTGGGRLRVHDGNREYIFALGDSPQRVTRAFDWERVLQQQHVNGLALFEIAPPAKSRIVVEVEQDRSRVEVGAAGSDIPQKSVAKEKK